MKKILPFLLFTTLLPAEEEQEYSIWDWHPLKTGGQIIRVGSANIDEGGELIYRKSNAFLSMIFPISMESFFIPRVELNTCHLNWTENPKFTKENFVYFQFSLTFYSKALDRWNWIVRGEYNIDAEHMDQPGLYSLFSGLLWGKYHLFKKWHYHVGVLGYSGLEGAFVYPVIGLDFAPTEKWLLEAIFPITYGVSYKINPSWTIAAKGRPLKERLRVGSNEPQPRSVTSYSSVGNELNVKYEYGDKFSVEMYGGYNYGGNFYIKNQHGEQSLYTKVQGAPYVGGVVEYAF